MATNDEGLQSIVKKRHVTFDESSFLGIFYLNNYMDNQSASNIEFSCTTGSERANECSHFATGEVDGDDMETEPLSTRTPALQLGPPRDYENVADRIASDEGGGGESEINNLEKHDNKPTSETESTYPHCIPRAPKRGGTGLGLLLHNQSKSLPVMGILSKKRFCHYH